MSRTPKSAPKYTTKDPEVIAALDAYKRDLDRRYAK